jgi:hypothetical protein
MSFDKESGFSFVPTGLDRLDGEGRFSPVSDATVPTGKSNAVSVRCDFLDRWEFAISAIFLLVSKKFADNLWA